MRPRPQARSSGVPADVPNFFRNGLANVTAVSKLCPLPDTAHELTCVAKSLGAPASSIVLGKDMTERALKTAPLNRYRVLHFATHGLLAGETGQFAKAHAEPALVMSPPETPTEADDMACSRLSCRPDADLSACRRWSAAAACSGARRPGTAPVAGDSNFAPWITNIFGQ